MSVVQVFLGRPRDILSSIFPSINCICDVSCLIRCPRYCSFLRLNCLTISLPVPILLITSSLAIFSVHDIFKTLRLTHISNASSLDNRDFVIVHVSAPYNSVGQIYHLIALNVVFRCMPRHDSSVLMLVNVLRAIIILLLISFSDLPSSVIKRPSYIYDDNCSICSPYVAILIFGEFGFLLTTIALVLLILIFIPNCFPNSFVLLVNSGSYFSFPANNAVSSAYLRLL